MLTGYYLACLDTYRHVWIGTLGDTMFATTLDPDLVSSFRLVHRDKALIAVSKTHLMVKAE